MQRIVITGSNGLVGNRLQNDLMLSGYQVFGLNNENKIDLRDQIKLNQRLKDIQPDLVIHCAAVANVELCQSNQDLAKDVNIKGTANLCSALLEQTKCQTLIYISTDLVFEKHLAPAQGFDELAKTGTFSFYAYSKLEAENVCLASSIKNVSVLRICLALDQNSERGYLNNALKNLKENNKLTAFTDEYRTPILVSDLSKALDSYLKLNLAGKQLFHVGGEKRISRYELAKLIAKIWEFSSSDIIKASIESYQGLVPRAQDVSLNSKKFWELVKLSPTELVTGLERIKNLTFC